MRRIATWCGCLVVALGLSACGSDSDGGGAAGAGGSGGLAGSGGGGTAGTAGSGGIQAGTSIELSDGIVEGAVDGGVRVFWGIPYARPPVGDLRFAEPQPQKPWSTPLDATQTPHRCPSINSVTKAVEGDEDCLTLNVWAPDPAPTAPRPVMVWIHGGGFTSGSGSEPTFEGYHLVSTHDIVLVTINYRLGPLGFFSHPAFAPQIANAGLLDQRLALAWVRDNVLAFGGDPHNVTIFGESAGGMSVCAQLASPGSTGLFHRAISQSGPCFETESSTGAAPQGVELAQTVGCGDTASAGSCLRGKSVEELLTALPLNPAVFLGDNGANWGPAVDGVVLPKPPGKVLQEQGVTVPVVFGTNANEGDLFVFLAGLSQIGVTAYETIAKAYAASFGISADMLLAQYPASAYPKPADALSAAITDAGFVCPARRAVRGVFAHGGSAYLYHFTRPISILGVAKAFHAAELPFVFHTSLAGFTLDDPADQALSLAMGTYWTQFAATADPNGSGVVWPKYETSKDEHLILDHKIAVASGLASGKCDFWDSI